MIKKKRQNPELKEQKKVAEFLWQQKELGHVIAYTATAQATYTGWRQIGINKALGVQRGLPDLIILLPSMLIFIEMKHPGATKSDISPEQKIWLEALENLRSVYARVFFTAVEAIDFLKSCIGKWEPEPGNAKEFNNFLNNT